MAKKRLRKLSAEEYEANLQPLLEELGDMARWVSETKQRVLVLFEGRDTAGKGGAIQAVQRPLNPRQCRVVALSAPTDREKTQWYFQRYVPHLPGEGEIVLFDRSWYNRAGVEKVMGFATDEQVDRFLAEVPAFEQMLIDDGILLFKYWLCCDQEKQEKRFRERLENPLKRWKLSPIDLSARQHYDDYTAARERMLKKTDSKHAPWTLVDFNNQGLGRLTLIRDLLDRLPDTKLPLPVVDWPPLPGEPIKESYKVLKPIKPVKVSLIDPE
ncbi:MULTISPECIES: polyphosphate kinase 2 [Sphingomonas]|uniref:polyphosphate kinase 2 n=1 Tax=Sphingomonas TaxID=13687 RepID=UPI000DEF0599|nr:MULTISPECIES: polyphosphate kinase 2 [Sphingomonas]